MGNTEDTKGTGDNSIKRKQVCETVHIFSVGVAIIQQSETRNREKTD